MHLTLPTQPESHILPPAFDNNTDNSPSPFAGLARLEYRGYDSAGLAIDGDKKAHSVRVGQLIAERAKAAGVETVVFDRGGYTYGGRIAALADAAREGGLKF